MNKSKFFVTTPILDRPKSGEKPEGIYLAHEVVAGNWWAILGLKFINQSKPENYEQK